jgi:hypothetical protein
LRRHEIRLSPLPSPPNAHYRDKAGPRLSGNETYVTVTPADDEADALPDAQKRCGTYGRIAHFKRMEGKSAVFDCDPR